MSVQTATARTFVSKKEVEYFRKLTLGQKFRVQPYSKLLRTVNIYQQQNKI